MSEIRKQRLLAIMAQATATIGAITANANKDMVMYEQWRVDYSAWIGEQRDIFDEALKELDSLIAKSEADAEITELRARVAELEKDAGRYRWLRSQNWNDGQICCVADPKISVRLGSDCPSLDRLDAVIDARISLDEVHQ